MLVRFTVLAALCATACSAVDGHPDEDSPPGTDTTMSGSGGSGSAAAIPLVADLCDDPSYADAPWANASSLHVTINFIAGTAADRDRTEILSRLESAYQANRAALGIVATPFFTIYLSPSRTAAIAKGRAFGMSWPGENRAEEIYTGAADSYEVNRFGHELTHLLEYYIDTNAQRRHPFLSEGLAEYLDRSGRDLHQAYAQQLIAGNESRVRVASLEQRDVSAKNYGRAGSFVQFLVARYGMPKFLEMFRTTAVMWSNGCWTHATLGCIGTPEKLVAMIDDMLTRTTGEGWAQIQPEWEAAVQRALTTTDVAVSDSDRSEIAALVAAMDRATATGDAALYRATLDGFYCDASAETVRSAIAARTVDAFRGTTSTIDAIYATGIKNFRTANAVVRRTDARGVAIYATLYLEHTLAGWRVTYGSDWY